MKPVQHEKTSFQGWEAIGVLRAELSKPMNASCPLTTISGVGITRSTVMA
jgi:hypothetical protein